MICPIMSKPINLPEKDHYNGEVNNTFLFEVEWKREGCAMWQTEIAKKVRGSKIISKHEGCMLRRFE